MCKSRDKLSAITLCMPLICYEYNADSWLIKVFANHLAIILCADWLSLKLALNIQPNAEELSMKASSLWGCLEV